MKNRGIMRRGIYRHRIRRVPARLFGAPRSIFNVRYRYSEEKLNIASVKHVSRAARATSRFVAHCGILAAAVSYNNIMACWFVPQPASSGSTQ